MNIINDEKNMFTGPNGNLSIKPDDHTTKKLTMLIEGKCFGAGPTEAAKKFGYTKQRFFQLLNDYYQGSVKALIDKKSGPTKNYRRMDNIEHLIIRYRFFDPDSSPAVIAQKLKQDGYKISIRALSEPLQNMAYKKKLYLYNPEKKSRYKRHWPGCTTAETDYKFGNSKNSFRLIGQRCDEKNYNFKPFIAIGNSPSVELITENFPER